MVSDNSLPGHVSPVFEEWCRTWTRATHGGQAQTVGAWWGPALNAFRRSGERNTEEIDIVGLSRRRVTVVGEAKWTSKPVGLSVLTDLRTYKLPALEQAGLRVAPDCRTLLFGKAGYTAGLRAEAERDPSVVLVDVDAELSTPP